MIAEVVLMKKIQKSYYNKEPESSFASETDEDDFNKFLEMDKGRCRYCKKGQTLYMCGTRLCTLNKRNCFDDIHTKM